MALRSRIWAGAKLEVTVQFRVVEAEGHLGPYKCTSAGYVYSLSDADGAELVSYHWHPLSDPRSDVRPHFHVGERFLRQDARLHVPTPRVSIEEFIRTAIATFGVEATVDEDIWTELLHESQQRHEEYRTWHDRRDAPLAP